jgi:hypothetical protein
LRVSDVVSKMASRLAALNCYERSALSRRKFAIRDFDAASEASQEGAKSDKTNPKFINENSECFHS